jgi:squalene-hopene/tetraprenyl-beta-curcumene cyclase
MKKTVSSIILTMLVLNMFTLTFNISNVTAVDSDEFWATAYYCVYESEMDGAQTVTLTISGITYTLKASFLFGGYGVAMQGTGRTGPSGDYIHYDGGGGAFVSVDDPIEDAEVRARYVALGITDFTGFGNIGLAYPGEATYSVVSGVTGASGRTLVPWYSIAVDPTTISLGTAGVLLFKTGTTPNGATEMKFRADDTGGAITGNHIDIYVGEGMSALNEWHQTGGNRYVEVVYGWTVMIYMAADNIPVLDWKADVNEMEMVGSTENVNIVLWLDVKNTNTKVYKILREDPSTANIVSQDITTDYEISTNLNSGDPENLKEFIKKTAEKFPANYYWLDLWDHGSGYPGVCFDNSQTPTDQIETEELKTALQDCGITFELISFDACLMGMTEVAFELRDYADYMVASEELVPGYGFPYDAILQGLVANPTMTGKDLAMTIVYDYSKSFTLGPLDFKVDSTMSAVDLTKIGNIVSILDELAGLLYNKFDSYKAQIRKARENSDTFPYRYSKDYRTYIDLHDFVDKTNQFVTDADVQSKATELISTWASDELIISHYKWTNVYGCGHVDSYGLSIYFPLYYYSKKYADLDLAQSAPNWPKLLEKFTAALDFSIICTSESDFYKPGETVRLKFSALNLRGETTTVWPSVYIINPINQKLEVEDVFPSALVIQKDGTSTFHATWNIPADAVSGDYRVDVTCWKDSEHKNIPPYKSQILGYPFFEVCRVKIISPTTSIPANAGDPASPVQIFASVTTLSRLWPPAFTVEIGGKQASYEVVDWWTIFFGTCTLKITPPTQPSEGMYDLKISAVFGAITDSDTQPQAIEYTLAPSAEPIEKGLAWLRTQQYGDGSWRSNVGVTSLTALAFLNAGYDETDPTVSKAINYILSRVHGDGSIYTSYSVYETSTAILALVATHNANYATIVENAKNWLVAAQQDEDFGYTPANYEYGGWTYWSGRGDPDLSNTQFALLALDAVNLPKTDPTWSKAIIFTQRCQNRPTSNDQAWAHDSSRPSYNDGGFIYRPWGWSLAGGTTSYGSMTGAGIWGLLLSGVPKTDERVVAAMNWVRNHYTWDTNPGIGWWRMYYYYLSMSKALTMYGQPLIDGHDWYQELYDKIVGMQIDAGSGKGYWSTSNEDYVPDLTTAYAILSLQTRAVAPPVQRLSYLTFILRSNCLIRIIDPEGNTVGYNYMAGLGENQIPTAIYSGPFSEPQYIVIINPEAGTYQLELIGISEGSYDLTIQGNYGGEVTDTFEYTGFIKPAELHGSDVTVTAIVGPVDIYTAPPEFEEIIDNIPPTTALEIGEPKYVDPMGNIYVTSATPFTLTAEDNPGGMGVASTFYRVYNSTYDTGLLEYSALFYLTGPSDGEYSIDYYSTDNIGNTEPTNTAVVILDNTPPTTTLTIGEPKYISDTTYVTPDTPFTLDATDTGSGVYSIAYRIYNATYNSGWTTYAGPFYLTSLADGAYTIEYYSIDNVQNVETAQAINVTLFSWNYIFEDTYGRGTTLKINLAHKFFQFITPDKDYGIRNATYMRQCGRAIIISHRDNELRLITISVDTKIDFCYAIAWDLQTCKYYLLIDKAGIE